MQQGALPGSISDKFKFWSFSSIVLIVVLHSYNLQQRFLQPWTTVQERLTPTAFAEYFIANGLLRFLIPMLFAISGFLYALHDSTPDPSHHSIPNIQRIPKRLRTLLLPYLAWSTFAITGTYIMELFPATRNLVFTSGIAYLDDHRRLLHDYRWYELLRSWLLSTLAYQLWFLRVLLVYNLLYPVLRWCILHKIVRWLFWVVLVFLWVDSFESAFLEGEGLLFFSLGIWMQRSNVNLETTIRRRQYSQVWTFIFIVSAATKTGLAFKGQALLGNQVFPVIALMHKLTIVSGLFAGWFGLDGLVKWCMHYRGFVWLTAFSFFIYAFHTPLVGYAINPMLSWLHPITAFRLLAFIGLPSLVIALSIGLGALCRRMIPGAYRRLTGGRGSL